MGSLIPMDTSRKFFCETRGDVQVRVGDVLPLQLRHGQAAQDMRVAGETMTGFIVGRATVQLYDKVGRMYGPPMTLEEANIHENEKGQLYTRWTFFRGTRILFSKRWYGSKCEYSGTVRSFDGAALYVQPDDRVRNREFKMYWDDSGDVIVPVHYAEPEVTR